MPEICRRTASKHSARGDLMFRRLLTEANRPPLTLFIDGAAVAAQAGDSVAAAMLAGDRLVCRTTPISDSPRAPYCLMGACFDCLVTIDGIANRQACMTLARDGMRIETQKGKRDGSGVREEQRQIPEQAALAFPPPLWGRDREGGKPHDQHLLLPPSPALPHKGGGSSPSVPAPSAPFPALRERYDVAVVGA